MDTPSTGSQTPSRALARSSDAAVAWERCVLMADLPARIVVTDPTMVPDIAEFCAPMADHAGPFVLEVVFQAAAPDLPERAPDEEYVGMRLWRDGGDLVVDSGGPVHASVTGTHAVVGGVADNASAQPIWIRRTLHHVLAQLLSSNGRVVMHGAAIGRDSPNRERPRAVLLLGASGMGKSSVAYLASRSGWSLMSDDLVVLQPGDGGRVTATGVHRPLAVPGEIAAPDDAPIPRDPRGRRRPALTPDGRSHDVAAVVVVRHGDGDGSLESVDGMTIATAVITSAPAGGNVAVAGESLRTAGALAALPGFRLFTPATPEARVAKTAGLLEEIARVCGMAGELAGDDGN